MNWVVVSGDVGKGHGVIFGESPGDGKSISLLHPLYRPLSDFRHFTSCDRSIFLFCNCLLDKGIHCAVILSLTGDPEQYDLFLAWIPVFTGMTDDDIYWIPVFTRMTDDDIYWIFAFQGNDK
jgi:hypothetical protein